jgi:hypothetical protein
MKAVAVAVSLFALLGAGGAPSLPGPGIVRVNAEQVRFIDQVGVATRVSLIYNPRITPRPIGNAIVQCRFVGSGGPLGAGTRYCQAVYSFPHGKIMATGLIKKRTFYSLAVTGGTGLYSNVGGELIVSTYAPRQERLLFSLETLG